MEISTLQSLWIPAAKPSSKIILVLHGRGDSYRGFQWLPDTLNLQDVNYLMVNAPDAYYSGYSWYDLPPNQKPGIIRSCRLLDQLFHEIKSQEYPTEDVLFFGFSQGCLMALEWGARTSHKLAGFVGISGYCYDPKKLIAEMSESARRTSWLVTHGTFDETLPFDQSYEQVEYLKSNGLPLEFHSFPKGHTIDPVHEIPLLREWIQNTFQAAPKAG